jgi:hypothetical protein
LVAGLTPPPVEQNAISSDAPIIAQFRPTLKSYRSLAFFRRSSGVHPHRGLRG